ncbi:TetR/AcrR family transcriptional regulator [Sphingomonas bacterium]|uniref:TetR/AcrR family transcriptional regulator n=1 Tax=Sphingomonas bacterium TaxID=1895847 RepID=UPI0015752E61|nr:TetR/AcrR family transcriptional regulator [Sphingomonas bacterium]
MNDAPDQSEGLRARKRRDTLARIAETGLRLFVANGYDATTLEEIAAATGISRRTFFYYFKSKEDVLLAWQDGGFLQVLRPAMVDESPGQPPLHVARACFLKLASRYETEESIVVDRLLRSTEALRLRKEAIFIDMERVLLAAMVDLWPEPERRDVLRTAAMMAMGVLRLALDDWRQDDAASQLTFYLDRQFSLLKDPLGLQ